MPDSIVFIVFAAFATTSLPAHAEMPRLPALNDTADTGTCVHTHQTDTHPTPQDVAWFTDAEQYTRGVPVVDAPTRSPKKHRFCDRSLADLTRNMGKFFSEGLLNQTNPDGDFKTGLCWFHTRFQRSATYLADYHPELPKPTDNEAQAIIDKIAAGEQVVTVPGFADLDAFSKAHWGKIERKLNTKAYGCIANGDCAKRLGDRSRTSPNDLKARMTNLYDRMLNDPQILFLRIKPANTQILMSHSLLVLGMEPIRAKAFPGNPLSGLTAIGYRLRIQDPNKSSPEYVNYTFGDTALKDADTTFVPNEDFDDELVDFKKAITSFCKK